MYLCKKKYLNGSYQMYDEHMIILLYHFFKNDIFRNSNVL